MKRILSGLLILSILLPALPVKASQPVSADLDVWMATYQQAYLSADPTALKPVVPVSGWPTCFGGDWSYQYPPDWAILSGDAYSFLACDARRLACFDYGQVMQFSQPYTHDSLGAWVFSRVAGGSAFEVAGTFQKNVFPNLMLPPPQGVSQVWFLRWQHPQAGPMFTLAEVTVLAFSDLSAYGVPGANGSVSFSWTSCTAPEAEFTALWAGVFSPMRLSSTYTIPGGGAADTDGDGHPDAQDNYPEDPNYY